MFWGFLLCLCSLPHRYQNPQMFQIPSYKMAYYLHIAYIHSPIHFKASLDYLWGEGNGNPLQYSRLENPMDGGAWRAAVHGVAKSRTRLSDFTFTFHFHALEKAMDPIPVLLPGKSHGWRSLEGCSPWGRWGSDMTERLHIHFSLSCIGEGNGNAL